MKQLARTIIEYKAPDFIREPLMYAKGLPLGKEKYGIPDYDIRPVIITDSIIRILDKIAVANIPKEKRIEAMGPYQMIGKKSACEIATIAVEAATTILKTIPNMALLNVDASNAYNSVNRTKQKELCHKMIPEFDNFYDFLYGGAVETQFSEVHKITMTEGDIQGLASSELLYSMSKWDVQQKVDQQMKSRHKDYEIYFQTDYIDDGLSMKQLKFIPEYMKNLEREYKEYNIKINKQKTTIVLGTIQGYTKFSVLYII